MAAISTVVAPNGYVLSVLRTHLPIESLSQVRKTHKELIHHFYMVYQPTSSVIQWLEVCNQKHHQFINQHDTAQQIIRSTTGVTQIIQPTGLTPLSIAILVGKRDVVEAFCASPHLDPEKGDNMGWTPLQHAVARGDPDILALVEAATDAHTSPISEIAMEEKGSAAESTLTTAIKTERVARERFPHLRRFATQPLLQDTDIALRFQVKPGDLRWLTQARFTEMTGAKFFDGVWGTPDALFMNWERNRLPASPALDWTRAQYEIYLRKKPPLLMCEFHVANYGVLTQKKIVKGQLVCTFGSEFIPPQTKEADGRSCYSNTVATGVRVRSYGSLINDGFPTVQEMPVIVDEVEVCGIIAICNMNPQDQLLLDYGHANPTKWGPRVEFRMDQILATFPQRDSPYRLWQELKPNMDLTGKSPEFIFNFQSQKAGLNYLFSTPSVLISMVLQKRLSLRSIQTLLKDPEFLEFVGLHQDVGNQAQIFYNQAFRCIEQFEKIEIREQIREDLSDQLLTNIRAGLLATQLMLQNVRASSTKQSLSSKFNEIFEGAEALLMLLEDRGSKDLSMKTFDSLLPSEKEELIRLSKGEGILLFSNAGHVQGSYVELEEQPS